LPQRGYIPLSDFFKNWRGEGPQARTLMANLTVVTVKCGITAPQNHQNIGNFWYKFAEKGYTPYAIFINFGLKEGVLCPHLHTKFHRFGLKMWAYSLKNREKSQFLV